MQINLESPDQHSIQSYSNTHVTINSITYNESFIVTKEVIIPGWSIHSIEELTPSAIEPLLKLQPELIIIGHPQSSILIPMSTREYLSKYRIGIECMSIGAASRTFNVLLGEHRAIVAGIIFAKL